MQNMELLMRGKPIVFSKMWLDFIDKKIQKMISYMKWNQNKINDKKMTLIQIIDPCI